MVIALRPSASTIRFVFGRVVMLAQIEDGDVGALAREQGGDRAADAAVGAGDQRDLALEPARARIERLPVGLRLELALVAGQRVLVDHLDGFGFGHDRIVSLGSLVEAKNRLVEKPFRPTGPPAAVRLAFMLDRRK